MFKLVSGENARQKEPLAPGPGGGRSGVCSGSTEDPEQPMVGKPTAGLVKEGWAEWREALV